MPPPQQLLSSAVSIITKWLNPTFLVLLIFLIVALPLSTPSDSTQQQSALSASSSISKSFSHSSVKQPTFTSSKQQQPKKQKKEKWPHWSVKSEEVCPSARVWATHPGSFCVTLWNSPYLSNRTELEVREKRAIQFYCEMDSILERFDCAQEYSVNVRRGQCKLCREAYREWACAMITDTLEDGQLDCETKLMPCPSCASICHQVMRLCPYLSPDRNQADRKGNITPQTSQYGGHPAFYCPLENDDPSDPAYTSLCFHQSPYSTADPDYIHNICINPPINHHQDPFHNEEESQQKHQINSHPVGNNNNARNIKYYNSNSRGTGTTRYSRHAKSSKLSSSSSIPQKVQGEDGRQSKSRTTTTTTTTRNTNGNDDNKNNNLNYNYYSDSEPTSSRNNVNYFNEKAEYNSGENFNAYDSDGGSVGGGGPGNNDNGAFIDIDEDSDDKNWSKNILHYTTCCWTYASSIVHISTSQNFPEYGSDRYFSYLDLGSSSSYNIPLPSSSTTPTTKTTSTYDSIQSSTTSSSIIRSGTTSKSKSKSNSSIINTTIGSGSSSTVTTPVNKKPSSVSDNRVILNCCDSHGACNSRDPFDVQEEEKVEPYHFSNTEFPPESVSNPHPPSSYNVKSPMEIQIGQPTTDIDKYKSSQKRSSERKSVPDKMSKEDSTRFNFHPEKNPDAGATIIGIQLDNFGVEAVNLKNDHVHSNSKDAFLSQKSQSQSNEDVQKELHHQETLLRDRDSLPKPTHISPGLDYDEHYIDTEPDGDGGSSSTELEDEDIVFEPGFSTKGEWEKGGKSYSTTSSHNQDSKSSFDIKNGYSTQNFNNYHHSSSLKEEHQQRGSKQQLKNVNKENSKNRPGLDSSFTSHRNNLKITNKNTLNNLGDKPLERDRIVRNSVGSLHEYPRAAFMEIVIGGVGVGSSSRDDDVDHHHLRTSTNSEIDPSEVSDVILVDSDTESSSNKFTSFSDLHFLSFDLNDNDDNNNRIGQKNQEESYSLIGGERESSGGGSGDPYSKAQVSIKPQSFSSPYLSSSRGTRDGFASTATSSGNRLLKSKLSCLSNSILNVLFQTKSPCSEESKIRTGDGGEPKSFRTFNYYSTDCCHLFVIFLVLFLTTTNFLPVLLLNLEDDFPTIVSQYSRDVQSKNEYSTSNQVSTIKNKTPFNPSSPSMNDSPCVDNHSSNYYRHSRRNEDERVKKAVVLKTEDNHDYSSYNYIKYYDDIRLHCNPNCNYNYYNRSTNCVNKNATVLRTLGYYDNNEHYSNSNKHFKDSSKIHRNPRRRIYYMDYHYYYYCYDNYEKNYTIGGKRRREENSKRNTKSLTTSINNMNRTFSLFIKKVTVLKHFLTLMGLLLGGGMGGDYLQRLTCWMVLKDSKCLKELLRNYKDDDRGDSCSNLLALLYYKVIKFLLILQKQSMCRGVYDDYSDHKTRKETISIITSTIYNRKNQLMSSQHNYQAVIMIKYTTNSVRNCSSSLFKLIISFNWFQNSDSTQYFNNKILSKDKVKNPFFVHNMKFVHVDSSLKSESYRACVNLINVPPDFSYVDNQANFCTKSITFCENMSKCFHSNRKIKRIFHPLKFNKQFKRNKIFGEILVACSNLRNLNKSFIQSCEEFCIENITQNNTDFNLIPLLSLLQKQIQSLIVWKNDLERKSYSRLLSLLEQIFELVLLLGLGQGAHFHGQSRGSTWFQQNSMRTTIRIIRISSTKCRLSNPLLLLLLLIIDNKYSTKVRFVCWEVGIVFVFYDARCSLPGSGSLIRNINCQLTVTEESTTKSSCNNNNLLSVNDKPIIIVLFVELIIMYSLPFSSSSSCCFFFFFWCGGSAFENNSSSLKVRHLQRLANDPTLCRILFLTLLYLT